MRALVTGASGFLGGHIVERLLANNIEVRCMIRDATKSGFLSGLDIELVSGNIRLPETVLDACRGVDVIFHAAAKVSDFGPWNEYYSDTVVGTANVVDAAIKSKVKKVVHVSTVDVYDSSLFKSYLPRISEDSALVTKSESYYYARAKMMAELQFVNAGRELAYSIIRPATIYGPRDLTIFPRIVEHLSSWISCLVKGFDPVLGLVHVRDVADLCLLAATSDLSNGQAYNASSDEDIRLRQYLYAICEGLNIPFPRIELSLAIAEILVILSEKFSWLTGNRVEPLLSRGALGFFIDDQRFEISKAKRDLGWSPKTCFADGIEEVIDGYKKENPSERIG